MLKHQKLIPKLPMMKVLLSLCLVASVSGQGSFCSSPVENVHFELVTGKVFTAPEDMLDSRPGTLMLTDCIDLCRANTTCRAANFETGLCVLFSSSAQQFPGKASYCHRYDFPLRTLVLLSHLSCLVLSLSCQSLLCPIRKIENLGAVYNTKYL